MAVFYTQSYLKRSQDWVLIPHFTEEIESRMLGRSSRSHSQFTVEVVLPHFGICWPWWGFYCKLSVYLLSLFCRDLAGTLWNIRSRYVLGIEALFVTLINIMYWSHILLMFCCLHVVKLSLWKLSIVIEMIAEVDLMSIPWSDLCWDSIVSLGY